MQEMIDEADRDGDGEVSLEEFERIMRVSTPMCRIFCLHLKLQVALWQSRKFKLNPQSSCMDHKLQQEYCEKPSETALWLQKTSLF